MPKTNQIVKLNEQLSMPIENMLKEIEDQLYALRLIEIGYEQANCNEERYVDHDDAIRILFDTGFPYIDRITKSISNDSLLLFTTLVRIKTAARWAHEFPNDKAVS